MQSQGEKTLEMGSPVNNTQNENTQDIAINATLIVQDEHAQADQQLQEHQPQVHQLPPQQQQLVEQFKADLVALQKRHQEAMIGSVQATHQQQQHQQQQQQGVVNFAPPPAQLQQQQPRSYASVSSALVKRFRVPGYAVAHVGVSTAPLLPFDVSHCVKDDPSVVFAVRLRDSFMDLASLLRGERGYVVGVLRQCSRAVVVFTPGKDPLLFIVGFSSAPPSIPQVVFVQPPSCHSEDIVGLPEEEFLIVQSLHPNTSSHTYLSKAVEAKYKNFKILAVDSTEKKTVFSSVLRAAKDGLCCVIPRKSIITAAKNNHSMSLVLKPNVSQIQEIAKSAFSFSTKEQCVGNFIQGKNVVRFVFANPISPELFQDAINKYGEHCKEIVSDDGKYRHVAARDNLIIMIKRIDNSPISENVAKVLVPPLSLAYPNLKAGALFGRVRTKAEAVNMHDTIFSSRFSVVWMGAVGDGTELVEDQTNV
jgi:hypothetical protein